MQICKAGAVAAGALATVAVMGSPAVAAKAAPTDAKQAPTTALSLDRAAQPRAGLLDKQPLISIGVSSSVNAAAWQVCGSDAVAGLGVTAAATSPHTKLGDCANSNTWLKQDVQPGLISILDDTSVDVASWQVCGSHVVAGVGLDVAQGSPATVVGDCHNANTLIEGPDGVGRPSFISLLSGSAIDVLSWQVCGSSAVMGLGAVVASSSPTTVLGDCTNAGSRVEPRPVDATVPILSGRELNLLPLQICETNSPASLIGLVVPLNSPALVTGSCYEPDGLPDDLDLRP
ncbi:MAG TPA: hypothetical protein VF062_19275 [Candidatus Limnocylindrales bacterium]